MTNGIIKVFLFCFIFIQFINADLVLTGNEKVEKNGLYYQLWISNNIGKARMEVNDVNFNCTWKNTNDMLCQYYQDLLPIRPLAEIGNIKLSFDSQLNAKGYAFAGINGYGKSLNESFFIIENYTDDLVPPQTFLGTTESIDGSAYDIYYNLVTYGPNHLGIDHTDQYWSVRKEKRNKGTIDLNKHVKIWKLKGFEFNTIFRICFLIEGKESNGEASMKVTKLKLK